MNYDIGDMYIKTYVKNKLPDGNYDGIWRGGEIEVKYNDIVYYFQSDIGTIGYAKVLVIVKNGRVKFFKEKIGKYWDWE